MRYLMIGGFITLMASSATAQDVFSIPGDTLPPIDETYEFKDTSYYTIREFTPKHGNKICVVVTTFQGVAMDCYDRK
jgi:hypothetical protein